MIQQTNKEFHPTSTPELFGRKGAHVISKAHDKVGKHVRNLSSGALLKEKKNKKPKALGRPGMICRSSNIL